MIRLADVVDTSATVRATSSRTAKIEALGARLGAATDPDELAALVGFLAGAPRQGRIGIGWATLSRLDVPSAPAPSLTVAEVDAALSELQAVSGAGSGTRRTELLTTLLGRATADERALVTGLLTGELRQGAQEGILLAAIALAARVPVEAVRRAHMLSGRLPDAAGAALRGGVEALEAFRLEVGRPVSPMLASPGSSVAEALAATGPASVEFKLDGARIQVHRDGDAVRVFTRTLREITSRVPELVDVVRGLPCRTVVLDGETLALTDDGRPRPFQETMSRFGAQDPRELLLRPWFFDVLHLDGTDLLDEPLHTRLVALENVAGEHRMRGLLDPSPEQAEELLDQALAEGHEGVVVKSLAAPYAAGRRGKSWQKVKPVHTIDLVVLAAEWGHGRRQGWLSNLHLGARDPDGGPPIMVGKTFKGLTDDLLRWQTAEFEQRASQRHRWGVEIRPEVVVEIALDGVQTSTRYPGGVALRFARVVRYRPDKAADDADTIDAVRGMLP